VTQAERLEILRQIAHLEQLVADIDARLRALAERHTEHLSEGHGHAC